MKRRNSFKLVNCEREKEETNKRKGKKAFSILPGAKVNETNLRFKITGGKEKENKRTRSFSREILHLPKYDPKLSISS